MNFLKKLIFPLVIIFFFFLPYKASAAVLPGDDGSTQPANYRANAMFVAIDKNNNLEWDPGTEECLMGPYTILIGKNENNTNSYTLDSVQRMKNCGDSSNQVGRTFEAYSGKMLVALALANPNLGTYRVTGARYTDKTTNGTYTKIRSSVVEVSANGNSFVQFFVAPINSDGNNTPPAADCKDNEKGNPEIDFGNNPTEKSVKQGETATFTFKVKNNNCTAKNYTLSVPNLPGSVSIASVIDITDVKKGNPKTVALEIKTFASTPVRKANNPYNLTIKVISTTNSSKDASSTVNLAVTKASSDGSPTTKYSCNSTTHACSVSTNGTYTSQASCESACAVTTCTNGTKQCSAAGVPQTCTNNAWVNGTSCTTGQTCSAGNCIDGTQPGTSSLSFVVGLDDIGTTGDNISNVYITPVVAPAHLTKTLKIELFKGTDDETPFKTINETITYSQTGATLGKFTSGTVTLPDSVTPGNYIVKITVPGHLTRQIPGIQNIQAGPNPMAAVNLVTGDIDGNNSINIHDYSILIGCSSLNHSSSDTALCNSNPNYKLLSDLNDDGTSTTPKVNLTDYSLLIREMGVQYGD